MEQSIFNDIGALENVNVGAALFGVPLKRWVRQKPLEFRRGFVLLD